MSSQSFADLGVSRPVVGALAKRGITEPFAVQRLAIADVLDGQRRAGPVADRVGQDARLRRADRRPDRAPRRAAPRRSCSRPPGSWPSRSSTRSAPIAHSRALKVAAVFGGVGIQAQARKAAKAHIVVATPGRLEDLIQRGDFNARARPDPRPRRGRPDARHGLQAPRRPDRRADPEGPPDAVLLGDARGRGRQARQGLHHATPAATCTSRRSRSPPTSSTASSTSPTRRKLDALVGELRDAERGRTLVFVRTKRGADRLVKKLGRAPDPRPGDARQQDPEPAPPRARQLRARRLRHAGRHRRRRPRHRRRRTSPT